MPFSNENMSLQTTEEKKNLTHMLQ